MDEMKIKPLSVNKCWKGKRYKTDDYDNYEYELKNLLKPTIHSSNFNSDNISLYINFAFSNKSSDLDNPVKPFIDICQKKFNFNDKNINRIVLDKTIVPKGKEYIKYSTVTEKLPKDVINAIKNAINGDNSSLKMIYQKYKE